MTLESSFQRLGTHLGVALLLWLFGILILIPLNHSLSSYISLIVLIPISILFVRSIKDIKLFSEYVGKFISKRRKTKDKPYIHFCYACWIIFGIILFVPFLYYINSVISGIFLFGSISCFIFIILINFNYILSSILTKTKHI